MIKDDIEELDKLLASRGWQIVKDALQNDILAAALGLAKSDTMSNDAMHFRRGAIYACANALKAPQIIRDRLHAELPLKSPAKAGPKDLTP